MGREERDLRAAQNRMMFRMVHDRVGDVSGDLRFAPELEFACECVGDTCVETVALSPLQFLAIGSDPNRFIVRRGHESVEVEEIVGERDGFLIVSVRD
jgi:hypothetical protein